ncbi:hypothetical protein ABZ468_07665 [Streptomyces sp. NPDC005708]|uniref:hypothetical protein n=1 Tax=Streptomyces sp. NPDC005708 TaxID=3154564 RepID=UPI0033C3A9C8
MAVTLAKSTDRPAGVTLAKATDRTGVALEQGPRLFFVLVQDGEIVNVVTAPTDAEELADVRHELDWADCLDVREVTAVNANDARADVARELATA